MGLLSAFKRWFARTDKPRGLETNVPSETVSADEVITRLADIDYDALGARKANKPSDK